MVVVKATAARTAMAKSFWLRMVFTVFSFDRVVLLATLYLFIGLQSEVLTRFSFASSG
jgi:hypothetical protein